MAFSHDKHRTDLTGRGRRLREELEPKLRRLYVPLMAEPVPTNLMRLVERLRDLKRAPGEVRKPSATA